VTCQCDWCKKNRGHNAIVERGNVDELKALIAELRNDLCSAEEDNNYYSAIHDGSWPSAKEQGIAVIEHVLERERGLVFSRWRKPEVGA
jgi:hypothetical protein